MATTLHLVRHGRAGDDDDSSDPGLSPHVVKQSAAVAERLGNVGATRVLTSPKRRAIETAAIIGERLGVPVTTSDLVDDRTPYPATRDGVPGRYHAFLDEVPPAERDLDAAALDLAVDTLLTEDDDDIDLVIVTHNFVIGWFVRRALDAPAWRWLGLNQDNAAISTIRASGGELRLVSYNDTGHLPRRAHS